MRRGRIELLAASRLLAMALVAPMTSTRVMSAQNVATGSAPTTYAQVRDFLSRHTRVIELQGDSGARVAICPEYQGRIMTSAFGGDGPSLGWVNFDFITAGENVPAFNNYGGEDRFWLGPEGGQFGLFFSLGLNQVVQNWLTPPDLNTGGFSVESSATASCRLSRRIRVTSAAEATFDLDVRRDLRVLDVQQFSHLVGQKAAQLLKTPGRPVPLVGFESENSATNIGPTAWDMKSGLVSIWTLGQFPAGDQTVIVIPYKAGTEQELGPVVQSDYFGAVPPDRLKVAPSAILFRGDGKYRAKLGVSAKRVRPLAGSIDLRSGMLTLVQFSIPDDPTAHFYVNNTWKPLQQNAFAGDVFNSYNDGPAEPGAKPLGSFYELETLSSTRPLAKGEKLVHQHRTFHIKTDSSNVVNLVKETLGVDIEDVRKFVGK
jgi:hypothetical protein